MAPQTKKPPAKTRFMADGLFNPGTKREEFVKLWMHSADLAATYSPVP